MKKNYILTVIIVLAIVACTLFISDGLTYLVASLMALAIMGTIQRNRSLVMKMTRWGKANPHKAQVLITVLQIALMALGIMAGYNFKKLGYELSDTTAFVFSTIIVIGFLSVRFLPERNTIAIPKEVNKQRFAFMGIALSSFVMMVLFGNRMEDQYPNSLITQAVKAIDQAIFPDNSIQYQDLNNAASQPYYSKNYEQTLTGESTMAVFASYNSNVEETIIPLSNIMKDPKANLKAEKKANKLEKKKVKLLKLFSNKRLAFAAGLGAGAILLIILLLIPLCAGICLLISGFSGGGAGPALLGVALAGGSIWGLIKIIKGKKQKTKATP